MGTGVPPPIGVIEPGVPMSRECSLLGVENRPLTGGPPAGFSDDGVLMFAAVGVKKPPTGFGVVITGPGVDTYIPGEAATERLSFVGDIMSPPPCI